jgi:hypothetical protein
MMRSAVLSVIGIGLAAGVFAVLLFTRNATVRSVSMAPAGEALREALSDCLKESTAVSSLRCIRGSVAPVIQRYGTRATMQALVWFDKDKEGSGFDCHGVAHIVGEVSAKEDPSALGETLRQCTRDCGFGCFHGAALGGLSKNPKLLDSLDSICAAFSGSAFPGQELTACEHSLGHGLAELAGRDPQKSFLLCDKLSSASAREACGTGVLMELIEGPILDHGVTLLKLPDDIEDFCRTLPGAYAKTCLINVGSYEYKRSGNLKLSFARCASLPLSLAQNCAKDLGTDFHFMFSGDAHGIIGACGAGEGRQREMCLKGALGSGLVTDSSGVLGIALCRALDPAFQKDCFSSLSQNIKQLHGSEKWSSFLNELNPQERNWCSGIH